MDIISEIRRERGLAILCSGGTAVLTVRLKDLEAHPLEVGDELDAEEYSARISPVQVPAAYEAALCLLDRSAKTARQIETSLSQKGFVPDVIEGVLQRLTENRLVDDQLYAERMVESAQRAGTGLYALKQKMRSKGLADDVIDEALSAIESDDQLSAARALAQKLAPRYAGEPRMKARAKLSQALARRGFSWDVISSVLEEE